MTRNQCILKLYQQKKGRKINMTNLTYKQAGDYLVPDLGLPPQPEGELNR
jgi:hypothetical protein